MLRKIILLGYLVAIVVYVLLFVACVPHHHSIIPIPQNRYLVEVTTDILVGYSPDNKAREMDVVCKQVCTSYHVINERVTEDLIMSTCQITWMIECREEVK